MEQKEWDFDSGNLVLDFANTAEFHASDHPSEMLGTYTDLISWSAEAGLLTRDEQQVMLTKAKKDPKSASNAYLKALEFREVIYRILSAIAGGKNPEQDDLLIFNRTLVDALKNTQISPNESGFQWNWQNREASFESMLWPLARESANLITSQEIERVGECADDRGCGYLFIDNSRNHSRRWCNMDSCGNRAKAQRHYKRKSQK
jgi:predicted RNA-binding Zn ribbon-like protein